jgi:hypothetical protein
MSSEHPTAPAAYYSGVFALFPGAGLFMGPAALVLGIKALAAIRLEPGSAGKSRAMATVVMGGLTSVLNWDSLLFFLAARMNGRV